jgi:hypothetical protein
MPDYCANRFNSRALVTGQNVCQTKRPEIAALIAVAGSVHVPSTLTRKTRTHIQAHQRGVAESSAAEANGDAGDPVIEGEFAKPILRMGG